MASFADRANLSGSQLPHFFLVRVYRVFHVFFILQKKQLHSRFFFAFYWRHTGACPNINWIRVRYQCGHVTGFELPYVLGVLGVGRDVIVLECVNRFVIPAIRRMEDMEYALSTSERVVVLLDTSLTDVRSVVRLAHDRSKKILVHVDLIQGLRPDEYGIRYLAKYVKPDGIISTRKSVIVSAKKLKLIAIQRLFMLDSLAMETGIQNAKSTKPDYIELLPGVIPKAVREVKEATRLPVITGGLIKCQEEVEQAFLAGAAGVTTSKKDLWSRHRGRKS